MKILLCHCFDPAPNCPVSVALKCTALGIAAALAFIGLASLNSVSNIDHCLDVRGRPVSCSDTDRDFCLELSYREDPHKGHRRPPIVGTYRYAGIRRHTVEISRLQDFPILLLAYGYQDREMYERKSRPQTT